MKEENNAVKEGELEENSNMQFLHNRIYALDAIMLKLNLKK